MRTSKRGRTISPTEKLRVNVGKMWDAGATQVEIADALQVSIAAVRYQLQKAGVPPDQQHKARPVIGGKRICVQCNKSQELTCYPTPRHATCLRCLQEKQKDRRS